MDLNSNLLSGGKTAQLKGYIHSILRNDKIRAMEYWSVVATGQGWGTVCV